MFLLVAKLIVLGTLTCQMIKSITTQCPALPSDVWDLYFYDRGPVVRAGGPTGGWYYYFDGGTVENWPVHDPCGTTADKHLTGIHPRGQIWVR